MMMKTPLILAAVGTLMLTACVDPNAYPDDPNARQRSGAIIGGLTGALAGVAVSGDGDELKGAIVGGALGAGTGALIGADLDRQAAELRGVAELEHLGHEHRGIPDRQHAAGPAVRGGQRLGPSGPAV